MNLKVKLNFLLAKLGLLFMKGNNKQLKSGKEEGYVLLDDIIFDLSNLKNFNKDFITIGIQSKDEVSKNLFDIVKTLSKRGKKLQISQVNEEVLTIDDIKRLDKINPNILVDFRCIVNSFYEGINVDTSYDVHTYIEIYNKFNFLAQVAKQHFKTEEEQFFFVAEQLNDYITYEELDKVDDKNIDIHEYSLSQIMQNPTIKKNCNTSGLKGAFLEGKTVCIGFALALQRVLTQLNIPCEVMCGVPSALYNGEDEARHSWNQVCLNGQWYNTELTWLNTSGKLEQLLASDKSFSDHIVAGGMRNKHECLVDYPKDKLTKMYNEMTKYKSVLREYDKGIRNIPVLPIKEEKLQDDNREEVIRKEDKTRDNLQGNEDKEVR